MVRKAILLSFILLSGCDFYAKDKPLDRETALALLNKKVATNCLSSGIDLTDTLSFNTLRRHYDPIEDKMKNVLPRDIITLAKNTDSLKRTRMEYLTQLGFFKKISNKIYVGKRGIRGYYIAPIQYQSDDNKEETTYEDDGVQYQLTQKGETHIDMNKVPRLLFCIGKVRIDDVTLYDYGNTDPNRIKVTFSSELYDTPTWLYNEHTQLTLPFLTQRIRELRAKSKGMVYIVKYRNKFIIENDEILRVQ